jgi:PAS domain S-box-containing protein
LHLPFAFEFKKNIKHALSLLPDTKSVYVVAGNGLMDKRLEFLFRERTKEFGGRVSFHYLNDLSPEKLLRRIEHLPDDSFVYYLTYSLDFQGKAVITRDFSKRIAEHSNRPVLSWLDLHSLGIEILGGRVTTTRASATMSADIVKRVFQGESINSMKPEPPYVEYIYEWKELKKWDIDLNKLPQDSVIQNRQHNFFDLYKWRIISGIILLIIESLLILFLWRTIRKRQTAENKLRQTERKYRSVVENANEAIIVTQDDGPVFVNSQAASLTGYSEEELLSIPISKLIHPDDLEKAMREYEERLSGSSKSASYTIRIIDKSDKVKWLIVNAAQISWEGKPGSLAMITDISQLKEGEGKLYKSEERYRTFVKKNNEGIWAYDLKPPLPMDLPIEEQLDLLYERAYISEANDALACMLGFKKGEELLGMRLNDFQPRTNPDNVAYVENIIREKFNVTDYELTAFGRAGEIRTMLNNIVGIVEDGKLLMVWGTSRDITKQKRLEKELRMNKNDLQNLAGQLIMNQEKELSRLARELHDDLTQQLAVAAIDAGSIEQNFKDLPEPVLQKISSIKNQLIKTSKEVHNMSRDLHPSIIDDLGMVRAVQSECSNFFTRTGIAVNFTPKNVPDNISKDIALSIYRIIQEGLSNIAKHANVKNAYVFLERSDHSLIISVRDTGIGFDQTEVRQQAALGLESIRERARLINGKSSVVSSPGKGTTIEVSIPL